MPDHVPSASFNAGGLDFVRDEGTPIAGIGDVIGRFRNNLSGATAVNMFNAQEAEKARQFNAAESQKARDFELYMSNTAYSRALEDMKKAGINPATLAGLNASAGGASTGSGNAASGPAASAGTKAGGSNVVGSLLKMAVGLALMA